MIQIKEQLNFFFHVFIEVLRRLRWWLGEHLSENLGKVMNCLNLYLKNKQIQISEAGRSKQISEMFRKCDLWDIRVILEGDKLKIIINVVNFKNYEVIKP